LFLFLFKHILNSLLTIFGQQTTFSTSDRFRTDRRANLPDPVLKINTFKGTYPEYTTKFIPIFVDLVL